MDVAKIAFSPTGGTEKVADSLARSLATDGGLSARIDLSDPLFGQTDTDIDIDENTLVVIAAPCYGGRIPKVAMERLAKIRGNGAKAVVVVVYGNRAYDDALLELKDGADDAGFAVISAIAAIAEHSIMHQFATGEPGPSELDALATFAERILEKARNGDMGDFAVPGKKPPAKAGSVPLVPAITGECVSCGECAELCPVAAIDAEDFAASKDLCIACMRCIQVCPQNARSINKIAVKMASAAIKRTASKKKEPELFI